MGEPLVPLEEFLWRTWGALGVSAWATRPPNTIIDLEALVVLTIVSGDERLIAATSAWASRRGKLVSATRLRNLGKPLRLDAAIAEWLAGPIDDEPQRPLDTSIPRINATTAIRARMLMGSTTRSEMLRVLHVVAAGHAGALDTSALVLGVAASRRQVLDAVADLVASGIVVRRGSDRRRRYAPATGEPVSDGIWGAFRAAPYAPWTEIVMAMTPLVQLHASDLASGNDPGRLGAAIDLVEYSHAELSAAGLELAPRTITGTRDVVRQELLTAIDEIVASALRTLDEGLRTSAGSGNQPWARIEWLPNPPAR